MAAAAGGAGLMVAAGGAGGVLAVAGSPGVRRPARWSAGLDGLSALPEPPRTPARTLARTLERARAATREKFIAGKNPDRTSRSLSPHRHRAFAGETPLPEVRDSHEEAGCRGGRPSRSC